MPVIETIPNALRFLFLFAFQKSPRWLVMTNRPKEAWHALVKYDSLPEAYETHKTAILSALILTSCKEYLEPTPAI